MGEIYGSCLAQYISGKAGAVHTLIGVHTAVLVTATHKLKGIFHYLTAHLGILIHGFMGFFHHCGIAGGLYVSFPSAGSDPDPALLRSSQHFIGLAPHDLALSGRTFAGTSVYIHGGRLYLHHIGGPGPNLCLLYGCLAVHGAHHPQPCTQAHKP